MYKLRTDISFWFNLFQKRIWQPLKMYMIIWERNPIAFSSWRQRIKSSHNMANIWFLTIKSKKKMYIGKKYQAHIKDIVTINSRIHCRLWPLHASLHLYALLKCIYLFNLSNICWCVCGRLFSFPFPSEKIIAIWI